MDRSAEILGSLGVHSEWCWLMLAVGCRMAPVLLMMPAVGSVVLPIRFRIAFACVLSFLLVPVAHANTPFEFTGSSAQLIPALGGELLLGLMLGTIFSLSIVSLQVAGRVVSQLAGFDFAHSTSAGSAEAQPLISGMFGWLALAVLFASGGHRLLLDACLGSFLRYPLGTVAVDATWITVLISTLQHSCDVGLRAAMPAGFALLVANLVNGIIARTVPQMNLFALGFSLNALTVMAALAISVGSVGWIFQSEIGGWIEQVEKVASIDP